MKDLIIATHNLHKFKEMKALLCPLGFNCLSLDDVGYQDEIIEDGESFFENAYIKAKTISEHFNKPALGDDSGLLVNELPGELGVKSKRFSKEETHSANNKLLLERLEGISDRSAHFVSVIVLYYPKGRFYTYKGTVDGEIAYDYKGNQGFGYDPIFQVSELGCRMAELSEDEKNLISHRGRALKQLIEDIENEVFDI